MITFSASHDFALQLDAQDKLASFKEAFVIPDPSLIYFDGNSLGMMPKAAQQKSRQIVDEQWGKDLIRGWNKGWWDAPSRVGDKIGGLIGAAVGQTLVGDTVSVNLFKLATSALTFQPNKTKIITDTFNFPSDLYILQGIKQTLGNQHEIVLIGSQDGDLTPDLAALEAAIDENTALVTLSHVVFKSGYMYDMQRITDLAHKKGALVLWDLSHSVGSVPVHLDDCNADFAIGCTYKYLNGGPGAPAFLYVNKNIQEKLTSPIWGWWGQKNPFDFDLDYTPAPGAQRFLVGNGVDECAGDQKWQMADAGNQPIMAFGIKQNRAGTDCCSQFGGKLQCRRAGAWQWRQNPGSILVESRLGSFKTRGLFATHRVNTHRLHTFGQLIHRRANLSFCAAHVDH